MHEGANILPIDTAHKSTANAPIYCITKIFIIIIIIIIIYLPMSTIHEKKQ